jgi:hypothetical protein
MVLLSTTEWALALRHVPRRPELYAVLAAVGAFSTFKIVLTLQVY